MRRTRRLERAYRATAYRVRLPGFANDLVLRPGVRNRRLDAWLQAAGIHCWSLLTAHNPASRRLSAAQNRRRQQALHEELTAAGYRVLAGENHAAAGNWPVEATFFVPALTRAEAARLARRHGQNAFLWGRCGQAARLCWRPTVPR
ncbi:MAG: DUF3293 domain-containing protein [Azoarcus sp.]|jgi:hypothetical protein|nr:DUF3293 domain-containing protein [Azoarcus sp.]